MGILRSLSAWVRPSSILAKNGSGQNPGTGLGTAPGQMEGILFQRLFWGTMAGCLSTLLLAESPVLDTIEHSLLEWRYKIAYTISSRIFGRPKSQDIVIVSYDDDDQFDLEQESSEGGPNPIQEVLTRLIPVIEQSDPLLVVVDLDLAGKADPRLVKVFRQYRSNIVLALLGNLEDPSDFPSMDLRQASSACAYDFLVQETNGLVCQLPIYNQDTDAVSDLDKSSSFDFKSLEYESDIALYEPLPKVVAGLLSSKAGVGPTLGQIPKYKADNLPVYINFRGTKYDTYQTRDILNNNSKAIPTGAFQDKVVIIGTKYTQKQDNTPKVRTPLARNVMHAQIQADAINTIHKNQIIYSFSKNWYHHLLVFMGGLLGALAAVLPLGKRSYAFLAIGVSGLIFSQVLFQLLQINFVVTPILAVLCFAYVFGTVIFLDTDLRVRNRELAQARETMQFRAEQERRRIANDLHDETLPALSSAARIADDLSKQMPDNNLPIELRSKLDNTLVEMRRVINDLHPSVLETMGFRPALENLLHVLERDTNISANFVDAGDNSENELSENTKLQLYRIVQEGLNNVGKHSRASQVEVEIKPEDEFLVIKVVDNGIGMDKKRVSADSHGLLNIRQRAEFIGAEVDWSEPSPNKFEQGTQLTLKIPILKG